MTPSGSPRQWLEVIFPSHWHHPSGLPHKYEIGSPGFDRGRERSRKTSSGTGEPRIPTNIDSMNIGHAGYPQRQRTVSPAARGLPRRGGVPRSLHGPPIPWCRSTTTTHRARTPSSAAGVRDVAMRRSSTGRSPRPKPPVEATAGDQSHGRKQERGRGTKAITLGRSVFLVVMGAILRYALTWRTTGVDLQILGLILIIMGIVTSMICLLHAFLPAPARATARTRGPGRTPIGPGPGPIGRDQARSGGTSNERRRSAHTGTAHRSPGPTRSRRMPATSMPATWVPVTRVPGMTIYNRRNSRARCTASRRRGTSSLR